MTVKAADLIAQGRRLARASPRRPRQVDLKRAASDAYYAVFLALAEECADAVVGGGPRRNDEAWLRVYRGLEHGPAKNACNRAGGSRMPPEIVEFAQAFVPLQDARHTADYNPQATFSRAEVLRLLARAENAVAALVRASRADRRAFVALVLFREPRR